MGQVGHLDFKGIDPPLVNGALNRGLGNVGFAVGYCLGDVGEYPLLVMTLDPDA